MTEITARLSTALADRYRIERHLGEGGMATVYLAEDLKHKRKVAVKVLRPELAAVLGAERFVQEITTTASLQHPNILPLFDSGDPAILTQTRGMRSPGIPPDQPSIQAPLVKACTRSPTANPLTRLAERGRDPATPRVAPADSSRVVPRR